MQIWGSCAGRFYCRFFKTNKYQNNDKVWDIFYSGWRQKTFWMIYTPPKSTQKAKCTGLFSNSLQYQIYHLDELQMVSLAVENKEVWHSYTLASSRFQVLIRSEQVGYLVFSWLTTKWRRGHITAERVWIIENTNGNPWCACSFVRKLRRKAAQPEAWHNSCLIYWHL